MKEQLQMELKNIEKEGRAYLAFLAKQIIVETQTNLELKHRTSELNVPYILQLLFSLVKLNHRE